MSWGRLYAWLLWLLVLTITVFDLCLVTGVIKL